MSLGIEVEELINALRTAATEAMDVLEATEDVVGQDMSSLGHNGVRAAARDTVNICKSLIIRLGGSPIEPASADTIEQPEEHAEPTASESMLKELEDSKKRIDEAREEPKPPEGIADLFDPELTPKQNQEALRKKYANAMSMREIHLANGEKTEAMELLRKAERYDSGIQWNRATFAEVI